MSFRSALLAMLTILLWSGLARANSVLRNTLSNLSKDVIIDAVDNSEVKGIVCSLILEREETDRELNQLRVQRAELKQKIRDGRKQVGWISRGFDRAGLVSYDFGDIEQPTVRLKQVRKQMLEVKRQHRVLNRDFKAMVIRDLIQNLPDTLQRKFVRLLDQRTLYQGLIGDLKITVDLIDRMYAQFRVAEYQAPYTTITNHLVSKVRRERYRRMAIKNVTKHAARVNEVFSRAEGLTMPWVNLRTGHVIHSSADLKYYQDGASGALAEAQKRFDLTQAKVEEIVAIAVKLSRD